MGNPSERHSDVELRQALADGTFEGRKAAVAEEILRRRNEEWARNWSQKFGWIGGIVAALLIWIIRLRWRSTKN